MIFRVGSLAIPPGLSRKEIHRDFGIPATDRPELMDKGGRNGMYGTVQGLFSQTNSLTPSVPYTPPAALLSQHAVPFSSASSPAFPSDLS